MIGTPPFTGIARAMRGLSVAFAVSLLVGFLALQGFGARYGTSRADTGTGRVDAALASAVTEQASNGLLCREEPAGSQIVLFQSAGDLSVIALSFEQALAASSAGQGVIRRYCR